VRLTRSAALAARISILFAKVTARAALDSAGLGGTIDVTLSVDAAGAYKPG
jgi:hypothetical protein